MSIRIVGANAMMTAPIEKTMSAPMMVGFHPYLSEITPPIKEPIAAPIIVTETIIPLVKFVISGKSSWMYRLAPPITEVS